MTVKLVVFAGSLRKDSLNKKLAKRVAEHAVSASAEVNYIDLNDYPMPLYNEDDETANGLPDSVIKLKAIVNSADGMMIASPEYNGSYSAVLKNTIDWLTRPAEGEGILESFKGKYAAIFATSPGSFGGLRGLSQLRLLLSGIGTTLLNDQVAIPKGGAAFNDDGSLVNEKVDANLERITKRLIAICKAMKNA